MLVLPVVYSWEDPSLKVQAPVSIISDTLSLTFSRLLSWKLIHQTSTETSTSILHLKQEFHCCLRFRKLIFPSPAHFCPSCTLRLPSLHSKTRLMLLELTFIGLQTWWLLPVVHCVILPSSQALNLSKASSVNWRVLEFRLIVTTWLTTVA